MVIIYHKKVSQQIISFSMIWQKNNHCFAKRKKAEKWNICNFNEVTVLVFSIIFFHFQFQLFMEKL